MGEECSHHDADAHYDRETGGCPINHLDVRCGVWESDEEQACILLAEALCGLADTPPKPELESSAASLAGVGLAILNHKVPMQRGTPTALATRKARDQIAYLLTVVDQNLVDNYLRYLAEPASVEGLGFTLDSDEVMDVAAQVVQRDDVEDALAILIDEGFEVTRPFTRALYVRASTNRPDLVALKAVSYAESAEPMAAWCTTPATGGPRAVEESGFRCCHGHWS